MSLATSFQSATSLPSNLESLSREELIELIQIQAEMINEIEIDKQIDALSGLHNNEAFQREAQNLMDGLHRTDRRDADNKQSFALVVIDVNGLKQVNDVLGHIAGNKLISASAAAFANCFERGDDFIARIGGDEFAMLLPNTREDFIRESLDELSICFSLKDGTSVSAKFSYGICMSDDKHPNIEYMLSMADEAMYEMKSQIKAQGVTTTWHSPVAEAYAQAPATAPA